MKLSTQQLAIVNAPTNRHIKVTAAPGSGKSTVCCHRILHLIEQSGVNPKRILATMFNTDAVDEFEAGLLALNAEQLPPIRTYHTSAKRCLEGLEKAKVIDKLTLETNEQRINSFKRTALEMQSDAFPDAKVSSPELFEKLNTLISLAKADGIEPEKAINVLGKEDDAEVLVAAYHRFEEIRLENKVRTFDDLLVDVVNVLESNERARVAVASKLEHIVVDEYQDINGISQRFIELLASEGAMVMVVGDDDQTISEFRGAKPYFIIEGFDKVFQSPLVFKLENTYRYGHAVSLLANNCIRHNDDRIEKWCVSPKGAPNTTFEVKYYRESNDIPHHCINQEAIIEEIHQQHGKTGKFSDVGILARVFSLVPYLEAALIKNEIPYSMDGGVPLLQTTSFKGLVYILCLANFKSAPHDKLRKWVTELMTFPRMPVKRLIVKDLINIVLNNGDMSQIKAVTRNLRKFPRTIAQSRCEAIIGLIREEYAYSSMAIQYYSRTAQINFAYRRSTKNEEQASRNIAMFAAFEAIFGVKKLTLKEALAKWLMLQKQSESEEQIENSVKITSVHRSKGLAWPLVIVPALCEGVFPHAREGKVDSIEAERRLFFVAITRAKQRLVMVTAKDKKLERFLGLNAAVKPSYSLNPIDASRFIFESHPTATQIVVDALGLNESLNKVKGYAHRAWFNDYLMRIGSDIRINR